ncbi:MAG: GNAT family N-acetyltransferase [Opitutaceae bacterium]
MRQTIAELPAELTVRSLEPADATACLRLSSLAEWNQSESHWRFLLEKGWGRGVTFDDMIVGTVVVLAYPNGIGWVGMILVDPVWRGRGLATCLLQEAVEYCESVGLVPALDATPEGQPIYKRLGFLDGGELVRMRRPERRGDLAKSGGLDRGIELGEVAIRWDQELAGHDRSLTLKWMEENWRDLCVGRTAPDGRLEAAAWGRRGRTAVQVGPFLARTPEAARSFLSDYFGCEETTWILDVPVRRSKFIGWLHSQGFEIERSFTRMMRGRFGPDFRNELFAVAGPELG